MKTLLNISAISALFLLFLTISYTFSHLTIMNVLASPTNQLLSDHAILLLFLLAFALVIWGLSKTNRF